LRQKSSAKGQKQGAMFEYKIKQPMTLERGQAANVPIISTDVEATQLSIVDTRKNPLSAVNGLRLHNTTTLYLAAGPVTIYENGQYAGDAQITAIAPDEKRLISYSLDDDLVIAKQPSSSDSHVVDFSIKN